MRRILLVAVPVALVVVVFVVKNATPRRPTVEPDAPALLWEKIVPPIEVHFETPDPPRLNEPVTVTLVVENSLKAWPASPQGVEPQLWTENRLEILLRCPVGVRLETRGWRPVEPSPEEKSDPSGPWTLFESEQPVDVPVESSTVLARVPISLAVVEEGTNWVISTRVRLIRGNEMWQTFGVLFATVEKEAAKFTPTPRKL
jgi:hypothetical protein